MSLITILSDDSNNSEQDLPRGIWTNSEKDSNIEVLEKNQCIDLTQAYDKLPRNTSSSSASSTGSRCHQSTDSKRNRKRKSNLNAVDNDNIHELTPKPQIFSTIIIDDDIVNIRPTSTFSVSSEYDNDRLFDSIQSGLQVMSHGAVQEYCNKKKISSCSSLPSEKSSPRYPRSPTDNMILDDHMVNILPTPTFTATSEYDNDRLFDTIQSGLQVHKPVQEYCNEMDLSPCSSLQSEKSSPRYLCSPKFDAIDKDHNKIVSTCPSVPSEKTLPVRKESKKQASNMDKENQNKQKAVEKAVRAAARLESKAFRPGECMKFIYLEVSPEMASRTMFADVSTILAEHGANVKIVNASALDPRVVSWSRRSSVQRFAAEQGMLGLSNSMERCPACMLVLEASEVCAMVRTRHLAASVRTAQPAHNAHILTLVICDTREYIKNAGKKQRGTNAHDVMTEIDLDLALTDLLVETSCSCVRVESREQFAQLLLQHTRAVAEEPYKAARQQIDEMADFYMRGDNKKCIAVDKDGRGLKRVWQQMLARLPLSSLEAARTITQLHPSPRHLAQSVNDGAETLASAGVRRAAVPGARARKLGPELARRIATLFSSTDGDQLLD